MIFLGKKALCSSYIGNDRQSNTKQASMQLDFAEPLQDEVTVTLPKRATPPQLIWKTIFPSLLWKWFSMEHSMGKGDLKNEAKALSLALQICDWVPRS